MGYGILKTLQGTKPLRAKSPNKMTAKALHDVVMLNRLNPFLAALGAGEFHLL